ncbi:hypothetical [Yersinia pestis KIM10+]|uniref:Uncharacterized protein n=1 Tax=Yersinia pestis TaxID=632 RepID=Q8CLQ0_YERPE|nr:hypothetical [Yersinia pestis KIM10+]
MPEAGKNGYADGLPEEASAIQSVRSHPKGVPSTLERATGSLRRFGLKAKL